MNDGLFSMEEKRERNDGKAMVSFMVPAALKNELQERARQLHTTATRLMAEAIQLRLRKNDGANDMDRIGADEFVKGNAIRTLIAARLTDESPAQAWVIAYRAERRVGLLHPSGTGTRQGGRQMSEEERIWADTLADAVEPANEYARRIRRKYMVSDRNDRYGIDHTLNIIGQAFLAGVECQAGQKP